MKNMGVGSWPTRRARTQAGRPAITANGRTWTFAEVEQDTSRIAAALRERGVAKGDRIAYMGLNSYDFLAVLFATAKLGAVFVPLNTRLAPPEVEYILGDCRPKIFFWDHPFGDIIEAVSFGDEPIEAISVGAASNSSTLGALRGPEGASVPSVDEEVALDDLFMIQYTSGTSGHPKGVMVTHGNITWNTMNCIIDSNNGTDSVALVMAPMFHSGSLNMVVLPTFVKGGHALLEARFDPGRALQLVESERVTFFFGVASMYVELMQHSAWESTDLSSLEQLSTGGQGMPEAMLRRLEARGLRVANGYGLTETSPGLTYLGVADAFDKLGSVGGPHFFCEVKVVDSNGEEAAPGQAGEIIARGPNVTPGYFRNPEATTAAFTPQGWLRTGDLGHFDEDGYLTIVDRVKDMIISGGENIYPAEVEQAIYAHPSVAEAAVVGVPDERWGEVGKAVVTLRPGTALTEAGLLEFLGTRIARYKLPKSVQVVDALPHTASGKILKRRVREMFSDHAVTAEVR